MPVSIRMNALLGALSLATDAAVGVPAESALRTCLTAPEWERVRLHAYHSERILAMATPRRAS